MPAEMSGPPLMGDFSVDVARPSRKQDHYAAGRLKLEEFRKKKAGKKKKPVPNMVPEGSAPADHPQADGRAGSEEESKVNNLAVQVGDDVDNSLAEPLANRLDSELHSMEDNGNYLRKLENSSSNDLMTANFEVKATPSNSSMDDGHSHLGGSVPVSASQSSVLSERIHSKLATNEFSSGLNILNSVTSVTSSVDRHDKRGQTSGLFNGQMYPMKNENLRHWDAFGDRVFVRNSGDAYEKESTESGVGSDGPLYTTGEDWKRSDGVTLPLPSSMSSDSLVLHPVSEQRAGAEKSAFMAQQRGSLLFLKEKGSGLQYSDFQPQAFGDTGDRKSVSTKDMPETSFSFTPSSKFNIRETFSSRPTQKSPLWPELASSTSPVLTTPVHSTVDTDIISSEPEVQNPSSAALFDDVTSMHDAKSAKQFEEAQRHMKRGDFADLELLIDELTQEKFSLQRALDAARSLAESLALENSALTENFNSQGSMINQLQADLDRQKDELKAQSVVVSKFMVEREKAQQESNSAMERSHILAGEVISLEEKVLKLRSNELKLQRDLESVRSECESCRIQLGTLEKDRQNLRSLVDALQEEKSLLLRKLQKNLKAASNPAILSKESRDACTSTDDLALRASSSGITQVLVPFEQQNEPTAPIIMVSDNISGTSSTASRGGLQHEEVLHISSSGAATFPDNHFRTITSIDSLITELAIEKESLLESIRRESSKASELEVLNAELLKKLELQTQRLELVFAQNRAQGTNPILTHATEEQQDTEFVDEGDEVVERVLGWIMRLFPGGSSKRRTSRLL